MLLALVVCHLAVIVAANPFHKYPFVFLLDVGNEELEKTNSEQIRVSVPGGSVALRLPAVGDGDVISHVRVSGIDFGTDLKANIVDGGPGYRYVVLVFMGNPGIAYDAVVTIETVTDDVVNTQNIGDVVRSPVNAYQSEEDANNSAEDLSDTDVNNAVQSETNVQNTNAELVQSSSNVYSYANNESMDDDDDDDDKAGNVNEVPLEDSDVSENQEYSIEEPNEEAEDKDEYEGDSSDNDLHVQNADDLDQVDDESVQVRGIGDDDDDDDDDSDEDEMNSNEEQNSANDYSAKSVVVDSNLYSKYIALKDHLNLEGDVYSQEDFQKSSRPVYQEDPLDYEDVDAAPPVYDDDDEINNEVDGYRDSNNNNHIDSGDSYAVAY